MVIYKINNFSILGKMTWPLLLTIESNLSGISLIDSTERTPHGSPRILDIIKCILHEEAKSEEQKQERQGHDEPGFPPYEHAPLVEDTLKTVLHSLM